MSNISLKRSLELLEANSPSLNLEKSKKKGKNKSKNPFMREPSPPKVTLSSIIKSKKKPKEKKNKQPQLPRPKRNHIVQDPLKKAEENVKKLLMFSTPMHLDNETTQKLIKRAQTQKYVIPDQKTKEDQQTVFTDEDFRKFEREYFCS